jgi:hypothetical protein
MNASRIEELSEWVERRYSGDENAAKRETAKVQKNA